jgi:hypothetical protein
MMGEQRSLSRGALRWIAALFVLGALIAAAILLSRAGAQSRRAAAVSPAGQLAAFRTEAGLRRFLRTVRARQQQQDLRTFDVAEQSSAADMSMDAQGEPAPAVEGITNNQEANVDEGGIVKQRGDILVILRRGRLFTVSIAGGGMRAVDMIDAFPPGVSGGNDWYDEMLLHGDRVIVVGYSYARGGTEINRFRLDGAGRLRFEDAYHLKSNDYYSSRNYASRVIGDRMVFYTPLYLSWRQDPLEALPAMRKWRGGAPGGSFRPIATARQVFISPAMRGEKIGEVTTLHSVTSCDLAAAELDCSAIAVLGPASRTFYVAAGAVYLWTADYGRPDAMLYRLPLGDEPPSAIAARGAPVDQFSFREDAAEGMINILLREEGRGDAMGGPEASAGGVSLLRLPLAELGDGSRGAAAARYRRLPSLPDENWSFHNRFVGAHVLYGGGAYGEGARSGAIVAAPVRGGEAAILPLAHAVERIEALGSDALAIGGGADRSLGFTAIELAGARPRVGDLFRLPAASEGETRSHAFFFRPDDAGGASGILGLPIARAAPDAYRRFFGSAASMLFLRRDERRFAPAGELSAMLRGVADDHCQASCTDWYGNARPIFLRGRIFALLGYELVEGHLEGGRIREIGRVGFSPRR